MKKLIYFTIGNNINYLKILKVCIDSLKKTDYDGDILFITEFENQIRENIELDNCYFLNMGSTDTLSAASNKLKIYLYENIHSYDKFIYCDLDTIWIKSPNILFDSIEENKIYLSSDYNIWAQRMKMNFENLLMSHDFWSGDLLNDNEIKYIKNNNITGFNSGFFAFNISMINTIKEIDEFLIQNLRYFSCLEQPYVNVFLLRNGLYDSSLNKYISHMGNNYVIEDFEDFKKTGVLLHFAAGIGDVDFKYNNMMKFIDTNEK